MKYLTFLEATRTMKYQARGDFFHSLSQEEQNELMDDYYTDAKPEGMLLQLRIISAAEMIEEEQKKEKRDENKIKSWMQLYDRLCSELEQLK